MLVLAAEAVVSLDEPVAAFETSVALAVAFDVSLALVFAAVSLALVFAAVSLALVFTAVSLVFAVVLCFDVCFSAASVAFC